MPKLIEMEYSQMMMAALGINRYSFTSPSLNWLQSLSPFLMIIFMFTCIALAALYVYQETRLTLILEAFVPLIGATASLSAYFNMRWKMDSDDKVNFCLQGITDQAFQERAVASIYSMTERKCRRVNKLMLAFALFEHSAFALALFLPIYCVFVGNFDTSTYYLPLRLAPPFNIDSLFGWYSFSMLQFICGLGYFCGTVVVTVYFVCCCFYLEALCDHVLEQYPILDQ